MSAVAFDVRTAFLVLAIVGVVQAVGTWLTLRTVMAGPLTRSQVLWIGSCVAASGMGLVIGLRPTPAPLGNLLGSHGFMLGWLALSWNALHMERGFPPRWRRTGLLLVLSFGVYLGLLATWSEGQATIYPALAGLAGSLLVSRQGFALHKAERSQGARLMGLAFSVTLLVLLIRAAHLLVSDQTHTSVSGSLSQVIMTVGGLSVFVLGNLGYLGLQIERLTASRLQAEVRQARAEERSLQAQERVRALQALVEERDLLIGRLRRMDAVQQQALLAAALPHELRQPLGAMRLNLDALSRSLSGKGAITSELVRELDHDTERLSLMIEEFMTLITPPASSGAPEGLGPVDLAELARSAMNAIETRARLAEVELQWRAPHQVHAAVCPVTIHQVLLILLTNALDAVIDQPLPRRVLVEVAAGPGGAELRVHDNGPGIAEHLRPHLFQPFASGKPQGSGIGLALAIRLARRVQADLQALAQGSGPFASGASFVVRVPTRSAVTPGA